MRTVWLILLGVGACAVVHLTVRSAGGVTPPAVVGERSSPGDEVPRRALRGRPRLTGLGEATDRRPPPELVTATAPVAGDAYVLVLGDGEPRIGVEVRIEGLARGAFTRECTNARGLVYLPEVPYDGSVSAMTAGADAPVPIIGRRTTLEVAGHLTLRVTFRDADTGEALPQVPFELTTQTVPGRAVAPARTVRAFAGERFRDTVQAEAPEGRVAFDGLAIAAVPSIRARSLWFEATLRREALVFLDAVDVRGRPVADACIAGIEVAGERVASHAAPVRQGARLRVRGVPHLRGEPVRVLACRPEPGVDADALHDMVRSSAHRESRVPGAAEDGSHWRTCAAYDAVQSAIGMDRLPATPLDALVLTAVFDPARPVVTWNGFVGIGRGSSCYRRRDRSAFGRLHVRVLDAAGRPVAGAEVSTAGQTLRTDRQGSARFAQVPAGDGRVTLHEPGWVKTGRDVTIAEGATTELTLCEDRGGEVLIRVLGEDGLPLSAARIEVPDGAAWADVEEGVQRLDMATNQRGERLLERFPAGRHAFAVTWGQRHGRGTVEVVSGERATLELRLPPKTDN